jgi:hypothetical protein
MMPLNIYTHMATPEEIRKKSIEESNKSLSESISLTAQLADKMNFLYKTLQEKSTLDKQSLDITKQVSSFVKNLSSDYDNIKSIQKDISKNGKLQADVQKQILSLEKEGGKTLKDELSLLKTKQDSLTKAQSKLAKMESDKRLGKKVDESLYAQAVATVAKKQEQLNVAQEILTPEAQQIQLLLQALDALEATNEELAEQERRQNNLIKSQSLITSALNGANNVLKKIGLGDLAGKLGLEAATKKAKEMTYELTNGGQKALGAFGKLKVGIASIGVALKSALGPMALIGIAVSLFNKFKEIGTKAADAIKAIDQNTQNLGRSLGVSNEIAIQIAGNARSIGSAMGVTSEVAISSAQSIYSALDGAEQVSQKTLSTFMKLNVFAGMSAESLAGMYRFAKLTGESAEDVAESIATTARESIKSMKVNVSMKQVMDGVSKTSNIIKINFKGSAEELTKAFVQSKKLGLELSKVDDIANSLLNFEDSIAAEMEAELLTGKQLNLEKAREAALMNDQVGLMEALAEQGITQEEFAGMNRIQQEAIAKSMGMSRESMADMLSDAKANEATNTELVDTQAQSLAAMQSIASIAERQLAAEEAKNLAAAKSGEQMIKFQNLMYSIQTAGLKILDNVFGPIGEGATGILQSVSDWLGKTENIEMISSKIKMVIDGIKYAFGEIYGFVQPIVLKLGELGLVLLPVIQNLWETIKPTVMNIKDFIGEIVGNITSLIEKLTTGNGEFTRMEKIIGSIVIGIGTFYATMKGIKLVQLGLNKATLVYQGIKTFIAGLNSKEEISLGRRIALGLREAAAQALKAVAQVTGMSATTLGIAAGIALAAGAAAYAFFSSKESEIKQAGDLYSGAQGGSGYGKRLLVAPEGTFALNNNDTVIAGTSLFKGDDVVSSPAGSVSMGGGSARLEMLVERLIATVERGGTVVLDGKKVGEALVVSSYRMQ